MTADSVLITGHASRRMAQRNVSLNDVDQVVCHDTIEHRTGVEFYYLAQRDIPPGHERELERLVGTTVVVRRGRIETVYRNQRALPSIKGKSKRRRILQSAASETLPMTSASSTASRGMSL
jgi:hypothetical protein